MSRSRQNRQPPVVERAIPAFERLPRPLLLRAESLPAGSLARSHAHPWIQLSYALSGVLQVRTSEARFVAPPQRAIWIPAGVEHEVRTSERAEMRSLYLDPAAISRGERCLVLTISPLLRELIVAVGELAVEYDEAGPAGRLVAVLFDRLAAADEVAFDLPLPRDRRLVLLCDALQAEPGDARSLEEWGRRIGLAGRSIARLFRRETGLSFAEWRLRLRLMRALALLEGGQAVTSVALDCGYASSSAFIVAFRRQFGDTPGAMFG
ncbi:helix-turn-helix domain-containing protein [Niveibacterium terrae]|uniref:helix-turn-helix domain-containing protein n=1 Tax=Niveibacterium terrae TaxID=3373598 RepID=UPI003A94C621